MGDVLKPVFGLIVAAGCESRMGTNKPLMRISDITVIEHILRTFISAGITHSCIVIGYHGDEIQQQLIGYDVEFVKNEKFSFTTMFDSVRIGLNQIKDRCSRVVFCPADVPIFKPETVKKMLKNPAPIVKPVYQGRRGHPIIINQCCLKKIISYNGDGGLRQALRELPRPTSYEIVEDKGTVMDFETLEDFTLLEEYAKELERKESPVTAGIIVATGYGTDDKQVDPLIQLGSTTLVRRQVLTMQLAGISPITLLTGWDGLRVENHLNKHEVLFFQMNDFMKKNLRTDLLPILNYLIDKCTQVVYSPVDYPLLRVETLKKLTNADGGVRFPTFNGKRGYPTIITMDEIRSLDISDIDNYEIFEDFILSKSKDICEIPVEDEGVVSNILDKGRCERILNHYNQQMQHPYVRLDIDYESKVFDPRLRMLLEMIDETHSVKHACTKVSMSVGMAWNYINNLEQHLGYVVVERRQGGRNGGETSLTEKGKQYLKNYSELERKVREFASTEFARIFSSDIS